jgi:putative NIF3 family GTP cyclohydrolase 1 type 2
LDAEKMGLTLIDAGHFPTEDTVIEPLCALLSEKFPEVNFITDHYSPIKVCINI